MNSQIDKSSIQDPFLSEEAGAVLQLIFKVALNGPLSVLGSAANVINIVIFFKQGFNDSVNMSLCALAVSDLGSLLPLVWGSISLNPLFQYSDTSLVSVEVHHVTGGLLHSCFVRTTGWITAFITFERCVCIALPIKVKNIITPRRTLISIVAMFVIIFSAALPLLSSIHLAPSFHAKRNKTLIRFLYNSNSAVLENFLFIFNGFAQVSSCVILIACTVTLNIKLFAKSEWRHHTISLFNVSESLHIRNKKIMKMVTFISTIFVICYFPSAVNLLLMVNFSREYTGSGKYGTSYYASWAIINTIDAINSSVTILVYYNMSSKYRITFTGIFFRSFK